MDGNAVIILDTHVLIWATQEPQQLGEQTQFLIERAFATQKLAVATITFWECQMLCNKGRIALAYSVQAWRDKLISQGLHEIDLNSQIAITSANLDLHGDPADRMIVATAMACEATLITADHKILAWAGQLNRHHAKH